jgi:hypothetical protein
VQRRRMTWGLPLQEATALTIPPFAHLFDAKMPMYIDAEVGQWPDKSNAEVAFCAGARPPHCVQDRAADFWNSGEKFEIISKWGRGACLNQGCLQPQTLTGGSHMKFQNGKPF